MGVPNEARETLKGCVCFLLEIWSQKAEVQKLASSTLVTRGEVQALAAGSRRAAAQQIPGSGTIKCSNGSETDLPM